MREDEVRTVPKVSFHAMQQSTDKLSGEVFLGRLTSVFLKHISYLTSVDESSHGFIVVTLQVYRVHNIFAHLRA